MLISLQICTISNAIGILINMKLLFQNIFNILSGTNNNMNELIELNHVLLIIRRELNYEINPERTIYKLTSEELMEIIKHTIEYTLCFSNLNLLFPLSLTDVFSDTKFLFIYLKHVSKPKRLIVNNS